ncbi:hypothetical protein TIFTF001_014723 [Ficus carica]|uniref:Uncharacterized protein n=1 Tax=Ficus carica TaxID=3494 RepID=A0AA88ARS0_FICCA|nr:hypothetical protein TIFTF001_014723 [Ficus carica]
MGVDDYFRKAGSVPFKWEIKPGVPRVETQQQVPPRLKEPPSPQPKLRPPPAGLAFVPPLLETRSRSFRSARKIRSERWRFEQPDTVASGCFPSYQLLKKKGSSKRETAESDDTVELETLARWSVSSRKSLISSFRDSTSSPSSSSSNNSSSQQSSPRVVSDADWAGFGLF